MKVLCFLLIVIGLVIANEAKRKRNFDGDFEFVEEDDPKTVAKVDVKKQWILDPENDRCNTLKCKKKELCLLQSDFTAVCVSKKEITKNGDIIISKEKALSNNKNRYRHVINIDDEVDNVDGDINYDDDNDNDDLIDNEDDDDDGFTDSDGSADDLSNGEGCKVCPIIKPQFLCGSDNRTYSSLCRLDYHNCIHSADIKVTCKGFCPCKENDVRKKQRQADKMSKFITKYQASVTNSNEKPFQQQMDKYFYAPEDLKYENKHYKYIKFTKFDEKKKYDDKMKNREYNEVIQKSRTIDVKPTCTISALQAMGDRLLDWFSVLMADKKNSNKVRISKPSRNRYPSTCKNEVRWMFEHLDVDGDTRLSLKELYDLEHDKNEQCMRVFIEQCDVIRDDVITIKEWCKCFELADRPCTAVRKKILAVQSDGYIPDCDTQGYYKQMQCHAPTAICWCVDKHGVEFANTRTNGRAQCEVDRGRSKYVYEDATDDEDDFEASGDDRARF